MSIENRHMDNWKQQLPYIYKDTNDELKKILF